MDGAAAVDGTLDRVVGVGVGAVAEADDVLAATVATANVVVEPLLPGASLEQPAPTDAHAMIAVIALRPRCAMPTSRADTRRVGRQHRAVG